MISDVSNTGLGSLGGALFCSAAAMVSLSVLLQGRGIRHPTDLSPVLLGLGVVSILGWGWVSIVLPERNALPWVAALLLFLTVKFATELGDASFESQVLFGGIALLPIALQVLI